MRLPRLFAKKRGHRRTGATEWGAFADGLFHALLLAAGLFFGGLLVSGVVAPEWRVNNDFVGTRCTILGKGVARIVERAAGGTEITHWQPRLLVRYAGDGLERTESWARITVQDVYPDRAAAVARLSPYRVDTQVPGWYDPRDPREVVLTRGYSGWLWLLGLLLPGALVVIGGTGLARRLRAWGRSEERLAASSGIPDLFDPLVHPVPSAPGLPTIPLWDDLVNSPGTLLRYRLPVESPESWTLVGFGVFAVLWNLVVVVLAVGLGLFGGNCDWWVAALLVPFAIVGFGGVVFVAKGALVAAAIGTTQVEISAHPLQPGERYDVLVTQGGSGVVRHIDLSLELEEVATFRQGTDTRSEQTVVQRQGVAAARDIRPDPTCRVELRGVVSVPAHAMHSFTSAHNAVRWKLVVSGRPDRGPLFTRVFPVVVLPGTRPVPFPEPGGGLLREEDAT